MVCLEGLKLATSYWDFIEVRLYDHPDYYVVKDMPYWIYSPTLDRIDKRHLYADIDGERMLVKTWRDLKEYVENKIIYIEDDKR